MKILMRFWVGIDVKRPGLVDQLPVFDPQRPTTEGWEGPPDGEGPPDEGRTSPLKHLTVPLKNLGCSTDICPVAFINPERRRFRPDVQQVLLQNMMRSFMLSTSTDEAAGSGNRSGII